MHFEKIFPLVKGLIRKILLRRKYDISTGGTNNSRYCYSVWMRHLVLANKNGIKDISGTVAEIGPGDSPGIGLTALLTCCDRYFALDVHKYWDSKRNLQIFDDLVGYVKSRMPIPCDTEFPRVTPALDDYSFPSNILTEEILNKALSEERIKSIRKEIVDMDSNTDNRYIKYFIPWDDRDIMLTNSVDFIFSQAVLQYVNDLDNVYATMKLWLKKEGAMSHSIDLSSHGITKSWNGHWLFTETEWKLIHGNNKVVLNRVPRSEHLKLIDKHQFKISGLLNYEKPSPLSLKHFNEKFKQLLPADIKTHVIVVQARKLYGLLIPMINTSIIKLKMYQDELCMLELV